MSRSSSPSPTILEGSSGLLIHLLQLPLETMRYFATALRRSLSLPPSTPRNQSLKPTAWLDGLRGIAALAVYFHHHQLWVHSALNRSRFLEMGFGHEGYYFFSALPGVRLLFAGGHFAVATFFVISGYALSVRPMTHIHSGDMEKLAQGLGSALFRRWIRLFLPVAATTFIWLTLWHAFGLWCKPFVPQETYAAEVHKWFNEFKQYGFLHKSDKITAPWLYWNLHTWSIPVEFRGSLCVYGVLLALSMCAKKSRMLINVGVIAYFLFLVDGWYLAMFLAGMLLCDIDLQVAKGTGPKFMEHSTTTSRSFWPILLVISIYLGSVPNANSDMGVLRKSTGWGTLSYLVPEATRDYKWFFLFWAAMFLVAAVPRLPWLRELFETRFAQYLGRVSYALYLVHGPIIWTLGYSVDLLLGWPKGEPDFQYPWYFNLLDISKEGPMGLEPAFWIGQLVLLPATLFVANLVTLTIDEPSVKFAAWVRSISMAEKQSSTSELAGLRMTNEKFSSK